MSRAQQASRKNVPAQLPVHQTPRKRSPQRQLLQIHPQPAHLENPDLYFEEYDYMRDFNGQLVECVPSQQLHHQLSGGIQLNIAQEYPRPNINELFRRGCTVPVPPLVLSDSLRNQGGSIGSHADAYSQSGYLPPPPSPMLHQPEYFYEQRLAANSNPPQPMRASIPVYRGRLNTLTNVPSYHKILPQQATPIQMPQAQPHPVVKHLQAQSSQTQYYEEELYRRHQPQPFEYVQPPPTVMMMQSQTPQHELYHRQTAGASSQMQCDCSTNVSRINPNVSIHDHGGTGSVSAPEQEQATTTNNLNISTNTRRNATKACGVEGTRTPRPTVVKKHPVTVRTPRFVRRPMVSSVYKKPSALCLPLNVQPDPAVLTKRHKQKSSVSSYANGVQDPSAGDVLDPAIKHSQKKQPQISADIQNEFNAGDGLTSTQKTVDGTKERLDAIMQRYDKIFRCDQPKLPKPQFNLFSQDIQQLKPRTPPSLKQSRLHSKDNKNSKGPSNEETVTVPNFGDLAKADTLQVEEMTTDMLDELLAELTQNGFNDNNFTNEKKTSVPSTPKEKKQDQPKTESVQNKTSQICTTDIKSEDKLLQAPDLKDLPKSFNYDEVKDSMLKAKLEYAESITSHKSSSRSTVRKGASSKKSETTTTTTFRSKTAKIIPRILVDDAMELHRTKSYVINLIDTALSRHLGTTEDLNAKKKEETSKTEVGSSTQQILKPHKCTNECSKSSNKDLAEEIAQVLNDNFSGCCNSRHSNMSKGISECSCKASHGTWDIYKGCCSSCSSTEEPQFVKQLRQMRWGHLRHIQQEMRRLEELERFLDSCNISSFDKCHYH